MRYLRQTGPAGKGKAPFPWTARKAARPDMVEYDPEMAVTRIDALKRKLEALNAEGVEATDMTDKAIAEAKEISELEAAIQQAEDRKAGIIPSKEDKPKTDEELDAEERQAIIDKDPDVIKIKAMETEEEIKEYLELEFGKKSKSKDVETLRAKAIELRVKEIFEDK